MTSFGLEQNALPLVMMKLNYGFFVAWHKVVYSFFKDNLKAKTQTWKKFEAYVY